MSAGDVREGGCAHRDDAAAYVLGSLTEQEAREFAAHLRECAGCREEVAALQPVADALPAAVPQRSAPAELRGRVLATVRSEAELRTAGEGRPSAGESRVRRAPWRLALAALAGAAAAAVVAVALSGEGARTRVIRAQVSVARAQASLQLTGNRGELRIAGMPQSPPGHIYEVWVQRGGTLRPTDALFTVSSAGTASVGVPGSLSGASAVMVTAEPRGGSSRPTSTPVIVARVG
jgi:anti-sigma-K factor RskA